MPVSETAVLNISCDNPACPGTRLDPTNRTGWFFINSEVYGQPTTQHVFCSSTCASVAAVNPDAPFGADAEVGVAPPLESGAEPPTRTRP